MSRRSIERRTKKRWVGRTCDALEQAGHGEDALAEDGLDTDAGQCAELGERHQRRGNREKYQRRLPRIWKGVVRHVEPADKSPARPADVAAQSADDVDQLRSTLPRTLVEDADGDGAGPVGGDGDRRDDSPPGGSDEPVRRYQRQCDERTGDQSQRRPNQRAGRHDHVANARRPQLPRGPTIVRHDVIQVPVKLFRRNHFRFDLRRRSGVHSSSDLVSSQLGPSVT